MKVISKFHFRCLEPIDLATRGLQLAAVALANRQVLLFNDKHVVDCFRYLVEVWLRGNPNDNWHPPPPTWFVYIFFFEIFSFKTKKKFNFYLFIHLKSNNYFLVLRSRTLCFEILRIHLNQFLSRSKREGLLLIWFYSQIWFFAQEIKVKVNSFLKTTFDNYLNLLDVAKLSSSPNIISTTKKVSICWIYFVKSTFSSIWKVTIIFQYCDQEPLA